MEHLKYFKEIVSIGYILCMYVCMICPFLPCSTCYVLYKNAVQVTCSKIERHFLNVKWYIKTSVNMYGLFLPPLPKI